MTVKEGAPGARTEPAHSLLPSPDGGPGRAMVIGSIAYGFILDYHGEFQPKRDTRKGIRHTSVFEVGELRRAMGGRAHHDAAGLPERDDGDREGQVRHDPQEHPARPEGLPRPASGGAGPRALQREINALADGAIRLSWANASKVRRDVEQRIEELTHIRVSMDSREAVRHAVSELAMQTAMRFVPGVVVDDIVDAYFAEVERENQRIENREITERVIDGTAWGLYNAFTYYTTHIAPRRRLATARSLHRHGRKFHGRIDWDRVRERASPHQGGSRRKVYLDPPRI